MLFIITTFIIGIKEKQANCLGSINNQIIANMPDEILCCHFV